MGSRERKLREYENRRKLIIHTAQKLYTQKGFANVTLEDIASEIEFSKGTIYSHFDSKEEIHARVLLEQLHLLHQELNEAAADSSQDFEHSLQRCLDVYLRFYHSHREYFQLLFFVDLFSKHFRIPGKLLKEIQYQKIACLSPLQKVIRKGVAEKELAHPPSIKKAALVLWGMLNGLLQLAESKQIKATDLDELIILAYEIVMKGWRIKNKNKT